MQSRKVAAEPLPALPKSRLARAMGIGSIAFAWAMGLAGFHRSRSLRVCLLAGLPVRRVCRFAGSSNLRGLSSIQDCREAGSSNQPLGFYRNAMRNGGEPSFCEKRDDRQTCC